MKKLIIVGAGGMGRKVFVCLMQIAAYYGRFCGAKRP